MHKLTGLEYLDYWRTRMARGADQAGFNGQDADRQGHDIWKFISPWLQELHPRSAMEFGCGHGRILRRLRGLWPETTLYGVDICAEAVDAIARTWELPGLPQLSTEIPTQIQVNVIVDCLALQHVTDSDVRDDIAERLDAVLAPGGAIVLFENVAHPGAEHMWDASVRDYEGLWPQFQWSHGCGVLVLGYQCHALMIGRKAA